MNGAISYETTLPPSSASRRTRRVCRRVRRERRVDEPGCRRHRGRRGAAHPEVPVRPADEPGQGEPESPGADVPEGRLDRVLDPQEPGRDAARSGGAERGRSHQAGDRAHAEGHRHPARRDQEAVLQRQRRQIPGGAQVAGPDRRRGALQHQVSADRAEAVQRVDEDHHRAIHRDRGVLRATSEPVPDAGVPKRPLHPAREEQEQPGSVAQQAAERRARRDVVHAREEVLPGQDHEVDLRQGEVLTRVRRCRSSTKSSSSSRRRP